MEFRENLGSLRGIMFIFKGFGGCFWGRKRGFGVWDKTWRFWGLVKGSHWDSFAVNLGDLGFGGG